MRGATKSKQKPIARSTAESNGVLRIASGRANVTKFFFNFFRVLLAVFAGAPVRARGWSAAVFNTYVPIISVRICGKKSVARLAWSPNCLQLVSKCRYAVYAYVRRTFTGPEKRPQRARISFNVPIIGAVGRREENERVKKGSKDDPWSSSRPVLDE